jgi:hypothetical protein
MLANIRSSQVPYIIPNHLAQAAPLILRFALGAHHPPWAVRRRPNLSGSDDVRYWGVGVMIGVGANPP